MSDVKPSKAKVSGYFVVRNPIGMPKVDNPHHVPDEVWASFTEMEKEFINAQVDRDLRRFD